MREVLETYPYLFEVKNGRFSFIHDSLNTFLSSIDESKEYLHSAQTLVTNVLCSILNSEISFCSRLKNLEIEKHDSIKLVNYFSNFDIFDKLITSTIDYESIYDLYITLRRLLSKIDPKDICLEKLYSLQLITLIIERDHLDQAYDFLVALFYTIKNHHIKWHEAVYSSHHLYSVFEVLENGKWDKLYEIQKNLYSDIEHVSESLRIAINKEKVYFTNRDDQYKFYKKKIEEKNKDYKLQYLEDLLINMYIFSHDEHELYIPFLKYIRTGNLDRIPFRDYMLRHADTANHIIYRYTYDAREYILSLGFESETNEYRKLPLAEFITKNSDLDSGSLYIKIANYLRLKNHLQEKIDYTQLFRIYSMQLHHKDYSIATVPETLVLFLNKGYLEVKECLNIVDKIRTLSTRDPADAVNKFINLAAENYMSDLVKHDAFNPKVHDVFLSRLKKETIQKLSDNDFVILLGDSIHEHDMSVDFDLIDTINQTRHSKLAEQKLGFWRVKIGQKHSNSKPQTTKKENMFERGYITLEDKSFIIDRKIKIDELAKFKDGWHRVLPYPELYEIFPIEEVKEKIDTIIYEVMTGKSDNGYIGEQRFTLFNILDMFDRYNIEVDWKEIFKNFKTFLEISLLMQI